MKNTKNIGSEKWKILLKLQEKFIVKLWFQKSDMIEGYTNLSENMKTGKYRETKQI